MNWTFSTSAAVVVAAVSMQLLTFGAEAQIVVSANDNKVTLQNGATPVVAAPPDDTVSIIDLGTKPPKLIAELKAPSSVVGPPSNVAISSDGSLALVSSHSKLDSADPKKLAPDNRVTVIDLKANPPIIIATLESGAGATGTAFNPAATLALVANRGEGTVSIFSVSGKTLTRTGKIDFGDPKAGPAAIAFSPDGKMALVTRDGDHRISVLAVDGDKVTDTKRVMTGGFRPYAVDFSPKGDIAAVGYQGANAGDVMPVTVIDVKAKAPRIVNTVNAGQYVEGLAFSPDGNFLAVIPQNGSNLPTNHPFYNDHGLLVVFAVKGTNLTRVAETKIGAWPQGVVWSRDGKTLLTQGMVNKALDVVTFDGKTLKVTGQVKVGGGPAGIAVAKR
jgi:DNA-binding beta-propeller fold protein YncE